MTAAACVAALLLAACNAGGTANIPAYGPTSGAPAGETRRDVAIAVGAEPVNLDFTTTAGAAIPQLLLNNVYETLVKIDQDGQIIPLLAESWTISDDRLTYDFTLRDGVTFSDGRALTAADVVASFDRTQTDWINALAAQMSVVASTEAVSDSEVRVTLSRPSNQWLFTAATAVGAIFPADIDFDLKTTAVGTGPFAVTEVSPGSHITLQGRSDYWGGAPALDTVTVHYTTDTSAAVNGLRAGDFDMVWNLVTGDQARALDGQAGIQVIEGTSTGDVLLSFNNTVAPFDDVRVRRAFAYAIDREAVMESAVAGYGTLVGAMVTPQDPYFEDLSGLFAFDPDQARSLLAEAGATNLHVTFDVPNLPYATTAAEVIQSQLSQVGVTVTINILEFPAVWLDQVFQRHDFQMSVIMHSEPRDLLTVMQPGYYLGYNNPAVLEQAAQADAGTYAQWVDGMKAVVRQIADDVPGVVLYLAPTLVVAADGLDGINANAVTESMDLTSLHWRNQ
ncbi:MAG: ABC transporter substrate-binding protein [Cellulomonadaceae bacterium]|jgi:peptide/nickel transport system substrate-binding protein|nr:ABC transporter substrate-binding protein [Cellulomonadaceae bacterium]